MNIIFYIILNIKWRRIPKIMHLTLQGTLQRQNIVKPLYIVYYKYLFYIFTTANIIFLLLVLRLWYTALYTLYIHMLAVLNALANFIKWWTTLLLKYSIFDRYGICIASRSSLSSHRILEVWVDAAIARQCDCDGAIVQWR